MAHDATEARRELLLKVYGAALDECRFNVQLSWDRTKFFLLLNSALIAAGVGLFKVADGSALTSVFLIFFFLLSLSISTFGLAAAKVGKGYYREAIFTKTVVEHELGLLEPVHGLNNPEANLSIAVTPGQRDHKAILWGAARDPADPVRIGSNVFYVLAIFWVTIIIDCLGAIVAAVYLGIVVSGKT